MTASWRADRPFNALPPPPGADKLETRAVLKAAIAANAALARLDQAAALLPNPTVLINAIPLLEAQASSEIENVVTTTDDLFRHIDDDDAADPATKETLRYRTALHRGFGATMERGVTHGMAGLVCSTIKGRDMPIRALPGTRIADPSTGRVTYSPPEGNEVIAKKLAEWEHFVHADDGMDPLVRMAAAHYQFEAIHPFTDGNGRTGRVLNVLMLVEAGLLRQPILYLSRYIIEHKSDYYRGLLGVTTERDWETWILYMLSGIRQASDDGVRVIDAIRDLREDFARRARHATKGGGDAEFLAVMFEQPYSRIRTVVERCGVSRPTATKWLEALVAAGLLADTKVGRDRLFINRELIDLLVRHSASNGTREAQQGV